MKTKDKLITAIMCLSIFIILIISGNTKNDKAPNSAYQVYLNGQKMGMIASKDELYDLINEEQKGIKEKYNVDIFQNRNNFKQVNNIEEDTNKNVLALMEYKDSIIKKIINKIKSIFSRKR